MNFSRLIQSRKLMILPPNAIGLLLLLFMVAGKQPPAQAERGEPTWTVRVIEVPLVELAPMAEGYGQVQPARIWAAVSRACYLYPPQSEGWGNPARGY